MRRAIAAGEFELYYQPVVNLEQNDVTSVEALVRWRHPTKGLILPRAFISVAEETGLILPLGEWVLRAACAAAAKWPHPVKISVNLSAVQLRAPGFVQMVTETLANSGLTSDRLELEVTETAFLDDSEATLATLYELRALGVRVAIDDFGTGYSSLSYLQSFPFDTIKIDRSFIRDIDRDTTSLIIVRAVAALAAGLGISTTAEGVETEQQFSAIRSEGCTNMQGFLFCEPLPDHDIDLLLSSARTGPKDKGHAAA